MLRDKFISAAKSQIGVQEPTGDDKFIKWYNSQNNTSFSTDVSWCAIFQSWCLRCAGVSTDTMPNFASCTIGIKWAKTRGIWHPISDKTYTPKAGNLIFFDFDLDGAVNHVGMIESISGNNITTIEGNAKCGYTVDGVRERKITTSYKYLFGYIDLEFEDEKVTTNAVTSDEIKSIQRYMVYTFGRKIAVDGIWGTKSKKALIACVQSELNQTYSAKISVDGVWGTKSKKAMPNIKSGCIGRLVYLIQACLILKGYDIKLDSQFYTETETAVKNYQNTIGLEADGIVGASTMTSLLK